MEKTRLFANERRDVGHRAGLWWLAKVRQSIQKNGAVRTAWYGTRFVWQRLTRTLPVRYSAKDLGSVLVEITTHCNLKCAGCARTLQTLEGKWENRHMSLHDFQKIVEDLPPADEIVTQGVGEPTLHPDLPGLIRIACSTSKFKRITLTSNALARDIEYYSQLFAAGLTTLFVSVDSFDPILVNRLRAGTSVEKLKERIRILAARFPGKVAIRTVVGRANIGTVPMILAELNQLGELEVHTHPYDDLGDPSGCLSLAECASFTQQIPTIAAPFSNLRVVAAGFIPSSDVCLSPWRAPAITVEGYLTPCCRILDKNVFNFGNTLSIPFPKIWNAPETEQWRKVFRQKSPSICSGCPWYVMR